MVVPDFSSSSVEKTLRSFGFNNIYPLELGQAYNLSGTSLIFSILPCGDGRDDSGIYLNYGDFSFLSTIDSNDLNSGVLPHAPTILATCASPGASGHPLCYDDIAPDVKASILKRKKVSLLKTQVDLVKRTVPRYFMPYASFFEPRAKMDYEIQQNNVSLSADDFVDLIPPPLLNVKKYDHFVFDGGQLIYTDLLEREDHLDDPEEWINRNLIQQPIPSDSEVAKYLENSGFEDNLTLYLTLCSDDFVDAYSHFRCDFSQTPLKVEIMTTPPEWETICSSSDNHGQLMWMKVRVKAFAYVMSNRLSWEDLSIGFQCRFKRTPDIYNTRFWDFFTNHYIGKL